MRVIAGELRGRRLRAAPTPGVRPTGDRVREALFSILGAILGPGGWAGRTVLDLYAGSGALAIEALSRGAGRAVLIERDPAAAAVIDENLRSCGLAGRAAVEIAGVLDWLRRSARPVAAAAFDVVFADPPYAGGEHPELVAAVAPWIRTADGVLIVEHEVGSEIPGCVGEMVRFDLRRYGRAGLSFYRRDPGVEKAPAEASAS